jgi:hypothetical protein
MIQKRLPDRSPIVLLGLVLCLTALAQEQKVSSPVSEPQTAQPLAHPMTEDQVRTYLKVCHVESIARQVTHEKMEAQRKKLPPWYIPFVWDRIEEVVDNIDLPKVMTPIYQKYISEEDATWLIRLSATPQMQKIIQTALASDEPLQGSDTAPLEARYETLYRLATEERDQVERILSSMSTADQKELEAHKATLQAMQPLLAQLRKECSEATQRKQSELAHAVVQEYQSELVEAKTKYEAEHPQDPKSSSPQ